MIMYFTNVSDKGPLHGGQYGFSIGVLGSPDNNSTIGVAHPAGRTADRLALWRLVVCGVEVTGRWVISDNRFCRPQ
jgi:hypothetical protein